MYRKKFSKASQELLETDADLNDWFLDCPYLFPYSASFKMNKR